MSCTSGARKRPHRLWRWRRQEVQLQKHLQLQLCPWLPSSGAYHDHMHISSRVDWGRASLCRWVRPNLLPCAFPRVCSSSMTNVFAFSPAITCKNPGGKAPLISQCSHPSTELHPGSTCSFHCEAGFELHGASTIQCSGEGRWDKSTPTCKGMKAKYNNKLLTKILLHCPVFLTIIFHGFSIRMSRSWDSIKCPDDLPSRSLFTCFCSACGHGLLF